MNDGPETWVERQHERDGRNSRVLQEICQEQVCYYEHWSEERRYQSWTSRVDAGRQEREEYL
jgi:hypothetical protein